MSEFYANTIGVVQTWLFEHAVQPMLFSLDMIALDEMAFQIGRASCRERVYSSV